MWITRRRLEEMLVDARQSGFDKGYRMANMNWKIAMTQWTSELEKEHLPQMLIEAGEILKTKSKEYTQGAN